MQDWTKWMQTTAGTTDFQTPAMSLGKNLQDFGYRVQASAHRMIAPSLKNDEIIRKSILPQNCDYKAWEACMITNRGYATNPFDAGNNYYDAAGQYQNCAINTKCDWKMSPISDDIKQKFAANDQESAAAAAEVFGQAAQDISTSVQATQVEINNLGISWMNEDARQAKVNWACDATCIDTCVAGGW